MDSNLKKWIIHHFFFDFFNGIIHWMLMRIALLKWWGYVGIVGFNIFNENCELTRGIGISKRTSLRTRTRKKSKPLMDNPWRGPTVMIHFVTWKSILPTWYWGFRSPLRGVPRMDGNLVNAKSPPFEIRMMMTGGYPYDETDTCIT